MAACRLGFTVCSAGNREGFFYFGREGAGDAFARRFADGAEKTSGGEEKDGKPIPKVFEMYDRNVAASIGLRPGGRFDYVQGLGLQQSGLRF